MSLVSQEKNDDFEGISKENFAVLEKLRLNQRDEHLKVYKISLSMFLYAVTIYINQKLKLEK